MKTATRMNEWLHVAEREVERIGDGWQRRRTAVSRKIEKSALKLYAERSIENVTVEEIAAASGISRRTFYRYFDKPSDVIAAAHHRSFVRMVALFRSRPPGEPIIHSFLYAMEHNRFSAREPEIWNLGLRVMRKWPEAWEQAIAQMQPSASDVYRTMFAERLQIQGRDPARAGIVSAALTAIILEVCREAERTGTPLEFKTFEAAVDELFISLGGLKVTSTKRKRRAGSLKTRSAK
jgi:AcrR family transcriptional regulator